MTFYWKNKQTNKQKRLETSELKSTGIFNNKCESYIPLMKGGRLCKYRLFHTPLA